jgi:hypothetical protein
MEGDATSRQALLGVISQLMREGKTVEVPVFGYSMMPFLKPGVTARIVPVVFSQIKKGDVLFFDCGGRLLLHRVLKSGPNEGVCRGDSLLRCDPPVDTPSALGVLDAWLCNRRWRTTDHWRFRLFKVLALYGGGSYQWGAWLYVRLMLKLARVR